MTDIEDSVIRQPDAVISLYTGNLGGSSRFGFITAAIAAKDTAC